MISVSRGRQETSTAMRAKEAMALGEQNTNEASQNYATAGLTEKMVLARTQAAKRAKAMERLSSTFEMEMSISNRLVDQLLQRCVLMEDSVLRIRSAVRIQQAQRMRVARQSLLLLKSIRSERKGFEANACGALMTSDPKDGSRSPEGRRRSSAAVPVHSPSKHSMEQTDGTDRGEMLHAGLLGVVSDPEFDIEGKSLSRRLSLQTKRQASFSAGSSLFAVSEGEEADGEPQVPDVFPERPPLSLDVISETQGEEGEEEEAPGPIDRKVSLSPRRASNVSLSPSSAAVPAGGTPIASDAASTVAVCAAVAALDVFPGSPSDAVLHVTEEPHVTEGTRGGKIKEFFPGHVKAAIDGNRSSHKDYKKKGIAGERESISSESRGSVSRKSSGRPEDYNVVAPTTSVTNKQPLPELTADRNTVIVPLDYSADESDGEEYLLDFEEGEDPPSLGPAPVYAPPVGIEDLRTPSQVSQNPLLGGTSRANSLMEGQEGVSGRSDGGQGGDTEALRAPSPVSTCTGQGEAKYSSYSYPFFSSKSVLSEPAEGAGRRSEVAPSQRGLGGLEASDPRGVLVPVSPLPPIASKQRPSGRGREAKYLHKDGIEVQGPEGQSQSAVSS